MMDWDKAATIAALWLIAGGAAFFAGWYAIMPVTAALAGTVAISAVKGTP